MTKFKVGDIVVTKDAGLARVYTYGGPRVELPTEDWEYVAQSADPMVVTRVWGHNSKGEDPWVSCQGWSGGDFTESDLKKVPVGLETWLGTNK